MKKVGIWMYENDNGINVKNKLIPLLKKRGYQVYDKFEIYSKRSTRVGCLSFSITFYITFYITGLYAQHQIFH